MMIILLLRSLVFITRHHLSVCLHRVYQLRHTSKIYFNLLFNFKNECSDYLSAFVPIVLYAHIHFFLIGGVLLLNIHFLVYFDCPSFLSHSNSVVAATNLARYPNLHSLGFSHDYGLPYTILISIQTPLSLWCMRTDQDSNLNDRITVVCVGLYFDLSTLRRLSF